MSAMRITKKELQRVYDRRYQTSFFVDRYFTSFNGLASQLILLVKKDLLGKVALDVGCGAGRLAVLAAQFAQSVDAFDLNTKAIEIAKIVSDCVGCKNTNFFVDDLESFKTTKKYDMIFYSETIEHVDDPLVSLKNLKRLLKPNGKLVISCPNFQNLRGYSYMSFLTIFELAMTLSDRREISPAQLIRWARASGFKVLTFAGAFYERGWGKACTMDMMKRLPLAIRDSSLPSKVKKHIKYEMYNNWLKDAINHSQRLINQLIKLKILKTRQNIFKFKFKRPKYLADERFYNRIKLYLKDGENKENVYHCITHPWNLFGGNNVVILKAVRKVT